jgi:hypothetical protein
MSYAVRPREGEGWLLFAAIVLMTAGVMRIFDAFWAFDKDDELTTNLQVLLFDDSLDAYGWTWLVVGALLVVAGFGVLSGSQTARWFGIFMAALSAISAFLWIYAFPIWSLVSVLISIGVIYALATYGDLGIGAAGVGTGDDAEVEVD